MHSSVASCLETLRNGGYTTLVATTPPSVAGSLVYDLYDDEIEGGKDWALSSCALLFGSEGSGLSDTLLSATTTRVTVAQRGLTQSLNVAVCTAMVLGEVTRRRRVAGDEPLLSDVERARMEAELVRGEDGRPMRHRSKAAVKAEMRRNRLALKPQPTYLDEL